MLSETQTTVNWVKEYISKPFDKKFCIFFNKKNENEYDCICPESLEFTFVEIVDFKQKINKVCLKIEINKIEIINIPLRFLTNLKDFMICDDKIYIDIPFYMFSNYINLLHPVKFELTNIDNDFDCKCSLISKIILSNDTSKNTKFLTQCISSIELRLTKNKMKLSSSKSLRP